MHPRLTIADQVAHTAAEYGPAFNPPTLALVLSLYRTMTLFDRSQVEELQPVELTVSQFNVLTVLHRAEQPITMTELAGAVSVRPTNLTGVVDGLSERGFVRRDINPNDRRSFLVTIAPAGEAFLAEFLPSHWTRLEELMRGLTLRERETLVRLLDRLRESIEDSLTVQPERTHR